jgi:heme-degrading monooxygenase HmoA
MNPVTLINCFQVPAERSEEFLTLWRQVNVFMRQQPGYLAHRLHRAKAPEANYRFVNIAEWASAQEFQAAHKTAEFQRLVSQPEWSAFPSTPGLFDVVDSNRA